MKKIFFIIVAFLISIPFYGADNVSFTTEAPESVVKGQQFSIKYILNNRGSDLRIPEYPDGLRVLMGPSPSFIQSINDINGVKTEETETVYTMIMKAEKEGSFNIAPATVRVNGRQYSSNATIVKILPPDKASQAQERASSGQSGSDVSQPFIRVILSKARVYEQEAVLSTIKLYSRNEFGIQKFDLPTYEGFTVQKIPLSENRYWKVENYNGMNYQVLLIDQSLLFPQHSGKLTISPMKIEGTMRVPKRREARSFFDDVFGGYQDINKTVISNTPSVVVEPLPSGKPASFMNAVGNFSATMSISSNHVKANEAVVVKIVIKGNGNLRYTKNPEVTFPDDFETYDPKVDVKTDVTPNGITGEKVIEYTVIPRFAGDFTIPGMAFSYFDLATKTYKTIETESLNLKVDKGAGNTTTSVVNDFAAQENLKLLGQDIRFIDLKRADLQKDVRFVYGTATYILWYLIPALLFAVFVFFYRKQARENANIVLMKTKKANKVAKKRLKLAGKYLKEHDKEKFYDEVLKAVWGYLSDKLNLPLSELNKNNVETEMEKCGVGEAEIKAVMHVLDTCEFARYAPVQSDTAMDELYQSTVHLIGVMENTVKK